MYSCGFCSTDVCAHYVIQMEYTSNLHFLLRVLTGSHPWSQLFTKKFKLNKLKLLFHQVENCILQNDCSNSMLNSSCLVFSLFVSAWYTDQIQSWCTCGWKEGASDNWWNRHQSSPVAIPHSTLYIPETNPPPLSFCLISTSLFTCFATLFVWFMFSLPSCGSRLFTAHHCKNVTIQEMARLTNSRAFAMHLV